MIDSHKHCPVCQTPIPLEETTCSSKCQQVLDNRKGQINKGKMVMNGIMIVVLLIAVFMVVRNFL